MACNAAAKRIRSKPRFFQIVSPINEGRASASLKSHACGSSWQDFRYITLPQLRPIVLLVCITAVIRSFQVFTIVLAMTQGGPTGATRTIVYHIYEQGIQYDEMGYASAAAIILLIIVAVMTYAQMRLGREKG